jgi:hypothetical protein
MASVTQHRARSRKRAEYIVATQTPADVLRAHAKAEDEFDFILADELMRALGKAADNEQRYSLTPAGHAVLAGALALMLAGCGVTEIPAVHLNATAHTLASMVESPRQAREHRTASGIALTAVAP